MFRFGFKKRKFVETTYPKVLEALGYNVKTFSLADQIAARSLGEPMAVCVGYKMAIAHCSTALSNASLAPKEEGDRTRELNKHDKTAQEIILKIKTEFSQMRSKVADLPETVQMEIAAELGLINEPSVTETEEKQLPEAGQATKDFLIAAQARIEELESDIKMTAIKEQKENLEHKVAPLLERLAKVVVEVETKPKEVPAGAPLTSAQLQEEIRQERGRGS